MTLSRRFICQALSSLPLAAPAIVRAIGSDWAPPGPVKISSVYSVGSGPDVVMRAVADKLTAKWKVPVIIDAKPGGAGVVAINGMKHAAPNGTELVLLGVGNVSINPLLWKTPRYDPDRELVPVAKLFQSAFFLAVGADSKIRNIGDLLAVARAKPGATYGSNAVGSPIHMASARLESALGVEMTHVAYREMSALYAGVATGELTWSFASIASVGSLLGAGKLKFLGVADTSRSVALPNVPRLDEIGGPKDFSAPGWVAVMAPQGTPPEVAAAINQAIQTAQDAADVRERLKGFDFKAGPMTPAQVGAMMREDRARYAEVVKRINISLD